MNATANLRPATPGEHADWLNGHCVIEGAVETEHGLLVPADQNVVIYSVQYREDDVVDGDVPRDDVTTTIYDCDDEDPVEHAIRIIRQEGLSFAATGRDWAADPDGSHLIDYREGIRVEVTAHLHGWNDEDVRTIIDRVG